MRRFFASTENFHDGGVTLGPEESGHIGRVLRLASGDRIRVFDGAGNEFLCEITGTGKKRTDLKIIEQVPPAAVESALDLTLAVSVTKGDKFDLVIQKAVELGVTGFVPLLTARCDVRLKDSAGKSERWQKIVIESSKQCGRAKLMELAAPKDFKKFIQTAKGTKILFAERGGEPFSAITADKEITAFIGPEGGWENAELEFAKANGAQIVTLKGRILRAETAAISIAAILQNRFGDLK